MMPQKLKSVTPSVLMERPDVTKIWTVREERMQNLRFLKLFDKEELHKNKFADSITNMKEIVDPRNKYNQHRLKPLLNNTINRSYVKKQKELEFCLRIEDKVNLFSTTWYNNNSNRNQFEPEGINYQTAKLIPQYTMVDAVMNKTASYWPERDTNLSPFKTPFAA